MLDSRLIGYIADWITVLVQVSREARGVEVEGALITEIFVFISQRLP